MRSVNKFYYENSKIEDDKLPFVLEITNRFNTVYYRIDNCLRKANIMQFKKTGNISISIILEKEVYEILVKGYDKIKNKFIYDIFLRQLENIK
jgi:hypothetical protein